MKMACPELAGQFCGLEVVEHDQRECARFCVVIDVSSSTQLGRVSTSTHSSCISLVSVVCCYLVVRDTDLSKSRIWPADGGGSPAETYPVLKRSSLL